MIARTRVETIGRCLPPESGKICTLFYNPGLSICNGFSASGLPLSLQIGGRPFEDALVLKVGDALEKAMGTRARRPAFAC